MSRWHPMSSWSLLYRLRPRPHAICANQHNSCIENSTGTHIVFRDLAIWVPNIHGRNQYQPRFLPLHALNSIKNLNSAFIIDFFGPIRPTFASSTRGEIYDVDIFKCTREICRWGVFEGEKKWMRGNCFDIWNVLFGTDYRFDRIVGSDELSETEGYLYGYLALSML